EDGSPVLPTVFEVPGDQIAGWAVLVSLTTPVDASVTAVAAEVAVAAPAPSVTATAPDVTAPATSFTSTPPSTTTSTSATFTISANETNCTFEVNLDSTGW